MAKKPILFASQNYGYLAQEMLEVGRFKPGKVARGIDKKLGVPVEEFIPFPDGERYHALMTEVKGREVVIVGGTIDEFETMEIFHLASAAHEQGALKLTIVMPYFGYSTMERAIRPGEAVKAKYLARMFSYLPRTPMGNSFYFMDLHTEGLPYYFENGVYTDHVYGQPVILGAIAQAAAGNPLIVTSTLDECLPASPESISQFVVGSTDAGRAKWVETYVKAMRKRKLNVIPAFVIKGRISGDSTVVRDVSADVEGRTVLMYDDIGRTCGSLIGAAEAYMERGAKEVMAVLTHGALPAGAVDRLRNATFGSTGRKLVSRLIVTNTHPSAVRQKDDFLTVVSTAKLFCKRMGTLKKKHRK
ncbi:MAG: ribose-phosphate diphosphokinase [Candidatus Obscuribacterales bacterium]|nr:ribose-phosphate diphosphokinase [Candidatus Obscuribacterales bacterium]